jgi:hypothetical protein
MMSGTPKPQEISIVSPMYKCGECVAELHPQLVAGIGVEGRASVIVSIYSTGGFLLANMGVLGLYLGQVYNEVRQRPLYVVRELLNFDRAESSILALSPLLSSSPEQPSCR